MHTQRAHADHRIQGAGAVRTPRRYPVHAEVARVTFQGPSRTAPGAQTADAHHLVSLCLLHFAVHAALGGVLTLEGDCHTRRMIDDAYV